MALISPQIILSDDQRSYTGKELRSHWIYETFGIQGDAAAAFVGPVDVAIDSMVDMADRRDGLSIRGEKMLHIILESFGPDLDRAVFLQKLLVLLAGEMVQQAVGNRFSRDGDDLFVDDGKLSVSIATVSPVSCLVHFGVNVTNVGTPVKTASLEDCGLDVSTYGKKLLERFSAEIAAMSAASTKVRGVK